MDLRWQINTCTPRLECFVAPKECFVNAAVKHISLSVLFFFFFLRSLCQIIPVWIVPSVNETGALCTPLGCFIFTASRCFVLFAPLALARQWANFQRTRWMRSPIYPCRQVSLSLRLFSGLCKNPLSKDFTQSLKKWFVWVCCISDTHCSRMGGPGACTGKHQVLFECPWTSPLFCADSRQCSAIDTAVGKSIRIL